MKVYPWAYKYQKKETVLLWVTTPEKDYFLTSIEGHLLTSSTLKKIPHDKKRQYEIQWKEMAEVDFDKFWKAINNLRENRASSINTCRIILDGWNFIEDVGRTFDLGDTKKRLRSKAMNKTYQKVFAGNNLPSVTPEGKSYSPLWEKEEIRTIKKELKTVWHYLLENGYIVTE